jgi:ABC-type phosphate transport system auxiliary subunit
MQEEDINSKDKKLSIEELRKIYDEHDHTKPLEKEELKKLVSEVIKETKKTRKIEEEDMALINSSVETLIKDANKDGKIDWSEFSTYFYTKDFLE